MTQLERLFDAGIPFFMMTTGAGANLQAAIWKKPGIGKVFLGAQFPYAKEETNEFLGFAPERYVAEDTAIQQAMASYMRAKAITGLKPAMGLGVTAAVRSVEVPRGGCRVHAAVVTDKGCWVKSKTLAAGGRSQQGFAVDDLGLDMLMAGIYSGRIIDDGDFMVDVAQERSARMEELFWRHPVFLPSGQRSARLLKAAHKYVYFPGSFNPPHVGHHLMAEKVEDHQTLPVAYTINTDSPLKGKLTIMDLLARAAFFRAARYDNPRPLVFTRDQALFVDKVRAIGLGGRFIVGGDTFAHLLDPKWGPSTEQVLEIFAENKARLYAFNRGDVRFSSVLKRLPSKYRHLFVGMGDSLPVSSTAVREGTALSGAALDDAIRELLQRGSYVSAIAYLRKQQGCGLMEAKYTIDKAISKAAETG